MELVETRIESAENFDALIDRRCELVQGAGSFLAELATRATHS